MSRAAPRLAAGGGVVGSGGGAAASAVGCAATPGGASGELWTAPTGALEGAGTAPGVAEAGVGDGDGGAGGAAGASFAGSEAVAVPGGGAGGGGGMLPLPNRSGEAFGEDGSAIGAAAAMRCALVRSAISPLDRLAIAARSGGVGLGGTVERFG